MNEVYIKTENLNKWIKQYFENKDIISIDDMLTVIEDLDSEVERLKEKIEDMEQNIEDNYKPIPYSEQVGISDKDFI
jgi:DNA-binding transcriptional regulator GbsR (MarR family)